MPHHEVTLYSGASNAFHVFHHTFNSVVSAGAYANSLGTGPGLIAIPNVIPA